MKRILFISLCCSVLLAGLVSCSNSNTEVLQPQGKVKRETLSIAPKIAGRVQEIRVSEGQPVKMGDTLAILDVPEIDSKLEQAEGALISAQGQFDLASNGATAEQAAQVEGQLDAALAQVQFAEESYKRMSNMYRDSLIPAQQFDEVKAKYLAAQAQLRTLQAKRKEIEKSARPENIKTAKGLVERAKGARNEVLQAKKETCIIAPTDMFIETISLKQGELATPGYTIFNGYQTQSTYFRFTIGEKEINAYQVSQEVSVSVPHIEKVIRGKIVAVKQLPRYADNTSTSPNYKIGESIFELKIVPVKQEEVSGLYTNSSVLLRDVR
jgi:HlyD family secretion protein